MKKIINAVDQVENQMIEGMVKAFPQYVKKLDCGNVVVRAEKKTGKVALISGGGSGHEPAHGGFVGKGMLDASADTISQNYFFYYSNGKVNDYHKRMQVPGFVYSEYNVGDSIAAYTTDHVSYSYYKYGILPDTEYTNNELMKVAGVLLGIGIFLLALFGVLSKKMNYKK